ncbi:MAG: transcription-repair coupling factor [Deltaproteobacteria bacterium]|nr:transcription-repair coupling factor [Deltaproteobacteria bacterium]
MTSFETLSHKIKSGETISLAGVLSSSQKAFILSKLKNSIEKPFIIITQDEKMASDLYNDLSFFHSSKNDIIYIPGWSSSKISIEEASLRSVALFNLLFTQPSFIIASLQGLTQKTTPLKLFTEYCLSIEKESKIDLDDFVLKIKEMGYEETSLVDGNGLFAIRGNIIDISPPHHEKPVRIELFGNNIESIKHFDFESQTSRNEIENFFVIPLRESILNFETKKTLKEKFKIHADNNNISKKTRDELLESPLNGIFSHETDTFLPFLFDLESVFSYLPKESLLLHDEPFVYPLIENSGEDLGITKELTHLDESQTKKEIDHFKKVPLKAFKDSSLGEYFFNFKSLSIWKEKFNLIREKKEDILPTLQELMCTYNQKDQKIFFVCSETQTHRLDHIFKTTHIENKNMTIKSGELSEGFYFEEEKTLYFTEEEIFGKKKRGWAQKQPRKKSFLNLQELQDGDYIVHDSHGIGRFVGLKKLEIGGMNSDFLQLEYAEKDKLYVPIHKLNLVQKYVGTGQSVPLDKLGTQKWHIRKKKASEDAKKIAGELIALYAKRLHSEGFSFSEPDAYFEEFEATFPYEETPDQEKCIQEVLQDMISPKPMDRLICGDVGFGKTEIAMRAAFKAVQDNKQAAFLVPTTLLAQQHYENFKSRLKNFPVEVVLLSRFVSESKQKQVKEQIQKGTVEIVIGTHRLLSKDIQFKNLGLLIIDEEHRFGVLQKEKITKMQENIDILTLSATPIPRTLHMALSSLRDLSIMTTPPLSRQSVRTFIIPFNEKIIRDAILKEIGRRGQVYFLHNRVQTIEKMTEEIQTLVPEAKIFCAHGQMNKTVLEKRMVSFLKKEFDVLVCSTIIGSGLDISSCNTIIINGAHKFGLADLYQLRGRVGRSSSQAYCYLVTPHLQKLTSEAKERLSAIEHHTELGSGFNIASQDLEIRGTGNLLGSKQSGNISAVGLDLYSRLLEAEAKKLRGEKITEEIDPDIKMKIKALIPNYYVKDSHLRLALYRRIASLETPEESEDMKRELQDRFGKLPEETENLLHFMNIKNLLKKMKVEAMISQDQILSISFAKNDVIQPDKVFKLIQTQSKKYKILPPQKFIIHTENTDPLNIYEELKKILQHIV